MGIDQMINCECCGISVHERAVEFFKDWVICQSCFEKCDDDEELYELLSGMEENSND